MGRKRIFFKNLELHYKLQLFITFLMLILFTGLAKAQADKKFIREGNKEFDKGKYADSEISYRRAIDKNKTSSDAVFNAGDALYKQKKFEDAGKQFIENHNMNEDKDKKSASLYNLGNSMLMSNKVKESIDAYIGSLKLNPQNMEAKYNLAYAQDLLKQQQQQQQKQKENQNKNDQNKDQKDKQNNKDQNQKDNQQKKQDQQQQQQQNQGQQGQQTISKEDAERILNALANDEKDVQEKVKLAKANKARVKSVINW
jgi:Ca-activated chloride channel family protein